ncbi:MAG TPA: hypothetical protein DEQ14_05505 [Treponema sp.]|nr:hypothetical protein [Treponema sp.]
MKAPRFFCDNCGAEVGRDLRACPQCGRFFSSVRCPACGFSGEEKLFSGGCPACGYSTPPLRQRKRRPAAPPKHKTPLIAAGALPPWVYIISIAAFVLTLTALFLVLFR